MFAFFEFFGLFQLNSTIHFPNKDNKIFIERLDQFYNDCKSEGQKIKKKELFYNPTD